MSEIENKKRTRTPPNNNGQPAVATSQSGNIAPGEEAMTKKSSTILSIGTRRSPGCRRIRYDNKRERCSNLRGFE
jgi:hypothetical protein